MDIKTLKLKSRSLYNKLIKARFDEKRFSWNLENGLFLASIVFVALLVIELIVIGSSARNFLLNSWFGMGSDVKAIAFESNHAFLSSTLTYIILTVNTAAASLAYIIAAHPGRGLFHHAGMQYFEEPADTALAVKKIEGVQLGRESSKNAIPGLIIGESQISRQREVGHISINGLPGGGKTVLSKSILKQIVEHGDRILIHDPKGDYTAFYPSDDFILFGPWDTRSVWWDIARDLSDPQLAQSFARSMFPGGGKDPFWDNAARELFGGVLANLIANKPGTWTWLDVADILSGGAKKIIDFAHEGDPNTKILIDKIEKSSDTSQTAKSLMSTIAAGVGWIGVYAYSTDFAPEKAFSVVDWLKNPNAKKAIILQNNKNYESRAEQIFGAFFLVIGNYMNSSAMPEISANENGFYFLLDEYPQMGKGVAAQVQTIMELGRSRGVRVIFMVQDESQLDENLGREKGRTQRSLQQTRIYCKSAVETADMVAKRLGNRQVRRIDETKNQSGKIVYKETITDAQILKTETLTGLKILNTGAEAIIQIDDMVGKIVVPFTKMDDVRPKVIESEDWKHGLTKWAKKVKELGLKIETPAADALIALQKDELIDEGVDPSAIVATFGVDDEQVVKKRVLPIHNVDDDENGFFDADYDEANASDNIDTTTDDEINAPDNLSR